MNSILYSNTNVQDNLEYVFVYGGVDMVWVIYKMTTRTASHTVSMCVSVCVKESGHLRQPSKRRV